MAFAPVIDMDKTQFHRSIILVLISIACISFLKVAMEGIPVYEHNTLYDIDRNIFVVIDPH